jgi:hypothetical protein
MQRSRPISAAHCGSWGLLGDQVVEAVATRQQYLVAGQVLAEDNLRERIGQSNRASHAEWRCEAQGAPGRGRPNHGAAASC